MRFSKDEIREVDKNFINKETWLNGLRNKNDEKCTECETPYREVRGCVALMTIQGEINQHLCKNCAQKYIDMGAIDIDAEHRKEKQEKEKLIDKIMAYDERVRKTITETYNSTKDYLDTRYNIKQLRKIEKNLNKNQIKEDKILEFYNQLSDEDWEMEDYLKKDYDIIQSKEYMRAPLEIKDFFQWCYSDFFDCGEGYYEEEKDVTIKIGSKFFKVHLVASIMSSKQDVGDRIYWVEGLEECTYKEIPEPEPMPKKEVEIKMKVSNKELEDIKEYLKERDVNYWFINTK